MVLTLSVHGLQCCPALPPQDAVAGVLTWHSLCPRPVDEVQIQRVALELCQGLTNGGQGALIAVVLRCCTCTKPTSLVHSVVTHKRWCMHTHLVCW